MGCPIFAKLPTPLVRFCPILLDPPNPPLKSDIIYVCSLTVMGLHMHSDKNCLAPNIREEG